MMRTTTRPASRYAPLSPEELDDALQALPWWRFDGGRLLRTVDPWDLWTLLERVAEVEAELDHHSVVSLDSAGLTFSVWTHIRPGLTAADVELAGRIEDLLG